MDGKHICVRSRPGQKRRHGQNHRKLATHATVAAAPMHLPSARSIKSAELDTVGESMYTERVN